MTDETGDEAVLEADLDLAREIVARNHAMKRDARDPARPRKNDLDPDLAPVKDLSFSTSKF